MGTNPDFKLARYQLEFGFRNFENRGQKDYKDLMHHQDQIIAADFMVSARRLASFTG